MKVLLINGSPHERGCTYTALTEVEKALNENGIETEIFWIGNKPIGGCVACAWNAANLPAISASSDTKSTRSCTCTTLPAAKMPSRVV